MGKTLSEIAQQLQDSEKKVQLIYAFNGVGKTRLSREFKELISSKTESEEDGDAKSKVLYYNAFTEDLFYWDNDLENDVDRKMLILPNSFTDWIFNESGLENKVAEYFSNYTNSKTTPQYSSDFTEVTFYIPGKSGSVNEQIKISKGEESNFIWCIFYSMLEAVIEELNEPKDNRSTDRFDELKYIFIDDPVSSLDENHLIELAVDLANLVKASKSELKFIITTHSPLFFNVLFNEFERGSKYILMKLEDNMYELQIQENDSLFAYHLYILRELKNAIGINSIKKYHFNLLRNILEKSATFLGYPQWGGMLKELDDKYSARLINLASHSSLSTDESAILTDEDKDIIKKIVEHLEDKYHFQINPIQSSTTTSTTSSR